MTEKVLALEIVLPRTTASVAETNIADKDKISTNNIDNLFN